MSTNLIIGYNNYLTASGVLALADSQLANFPAENILTDHREQVWMAADGVLGHSVMFDLGAAKAVDLAATFDVNVLQDVTDVSFSASNNGAVWGDPANVNWAINYAIFTRLNSSAAAPPTLNRSAGYVFDPPVTARYWMISFLSDVGGGDTYVSTGKSFIGQALTFANNYVAPVPFQPEDYSADTYTPYGAANLKRRGTRMRGSFAIPFNTRAQQLDIVAVIDGVGTHTPFPLLLDFDGTVAATANRSTFWAKFTSSPQYQQVAGDLFSYTFDWRECT